MDNYAEKMQRCNEYMEALEEERRKIQVFQRELPLCLELVTQAIDACRQQLPGTTDYFHGQSESSEQTSSDGPVLEEFIPIKRTSSDDAVANEDDDDDIQQSNKTKNTKDKNIDKSGKKSDWLRSVQLWNQTPDPPLKEDPPKKAPAMEVKKNSGAFKPFNREKGVKTSPTSMDKSPSTVPTAAASSSAETVTEGSGGSKREEVEGQSRRKQRRCWSPELHRRFLNALQQLGGTHAVATPKQIRELMKVDGLTNDEVKSHLQKYRLHTRRPSPTIHNNGNPQAPQFVVVGGIWVQPPEYAAMAAKTASGEATGAAGANGIYAPVAAPPPSFPQASTSVTQRQQQKQSKQTHSEQRGSHSEGGVRSSSPATSSSTHTTTASPVF